ncbi:MAG: DNA polymerase III subunit gamma/tau [Deltaproteobacteria bacterium]|nr:DNA polymerase III subunit gamma/tau [Deltaproteobacteria bacterium]
MSYRVLARKWRPQVFEEVVGQEHVATTLQNAIKTDKVAHAFLFAGARGVGKTSVARIMAKALNCRAGEKAVPCNHCDSCREISEGISVDVQEIDGASNRGIDEIRDLRESIRYFPSKSPYKIYIIDEVHMLTLPAFNALLKTLEEPPDHAIFIFATTEAHKVPITIRSRCQRFDFKRISISDIFNHLKRICLAEGIDVEDKALRLVAREGDGSMRDSESLLDQAISFAGNHLVYDKVVEILGVADRLHLPALTQAIFSQDTRTLLDIVAAVYNYGLDLKQFFSHVVEHFRNMILVALNSGDAASLSATEDEIAELKSLSSMVPVESLVQYFGVLMKSESELRMTAYPRLAMELIMIRLTRLGDVKPIEEILRKVDELSRGLNPSGPGSTRTGATPAGPPAKSGPDRPSPTPVKARPEPAKVPEPVIPDQQPAVAQVTEASSTPRSAQTSAPPPPDPDEPPPPDLAPADLLEQDKALDHPSIEPKVPPVQETLPTPATAQPVADSGPDIPPFAAESWPGFLAYVRDNSTPVLSDKLNAAQLADISGDVLALRAASPFVADQVTRLREMAGTFFGREIKIVFGSAPRSEPAMMPPETQIEQEVLNRARNNPIIQEAISLFQGEVHSIRNILPQINEEEESGAEPEANDPASEE